MKKFIISENNFYFDVFVMKLLLQTKIMKVRSFSEQNDPPGDNKSKPTPKGREEVPTAFDWTKRWLKGDQYAYILQNIDLYCQKFGFQKYDFKCHPDSIYKHPINGLIYFVRGKGVGSDFGFPRVNGKKKYRWKKMNFTTDLPKKNPYVTYVVASAMKANTMDNECDAPDYRMHAVIPYKNQGSAQQSDSQYILCHVRQVQHKKNQEQQISIQNCFIRGKPDFLRLFCYLHSVCPSSPSK